MSILIQILKRKKSIIFFLITFFSVLISFSQEVTKERVGNSPEKHINATRGPGTGASILVPNDDNQHGGTPKELVENILASSCVEVVSARFGYYDKVNDNWVTNFGNNTLERQLGYFNEGAAQNFPIEEGLLLSTGEIQNAMGPSASEGFSDEMERRASDPDLTLITNRILFDAAVLEIDFIPVGDNIEFQFIFASDEYLEYCGTEYEDIFGFFLSGPGVSGGVGYQNDAVNLAELPNGDPITINTIHPAVQSNVEGNSVPASNEAYYANNNYAISTEFDGGTVILTAKYLGVTSGSQYKMKLAIADASDQKWDAGMFLQAKSFSTVDAGSYGSVCVDGADITLVGSPLGGVWSGTGVTGNTFDPSVGTQTLTYTYTEGNTCSDSDTTTITVNDLPVVDAGNYGPVCIDGADITLVGSPLGGTWNGIGVTDNGDGTAIFDPTVANAGNAIYTYTDENTCADSDLTTITVNDLPVVDAGSYGPVCIDGADITLIGSPVGGVWSGTGVTGNTFDPSVGTQTLTYTYTNTNDCTNTDDTIIEIYESPTADITSPVNVLCFGDATGEATVTVEGGTAPYTYSWDNGQTEATATGLVAGDYIVTVTDNNGCTTTATATIEQPVAALSVSITSEIDVLCYGEATGSATALAAGGTAPYTYSWDNGQTEATATGLVAGDYVVTVTDANGCTTTAEVTIAQPSAPLTIEITSQEDELCYGDANGAVDITVSGGTPGYLYLWTTIDGSGLDPNAEDQTGLTAGTYEVEITDANGCTITETVIIDGPQSALTITITSQVNELCFGDANGEINISVSGGTTEYSYLWSNGQPTQDLFNLYPGTYSVLVTDTNGCTATASATITGPDEELTSEITSQTAVLCYEDNSGEIDLTVNGGTPDYTYLWSTTDGSGLVVDAEDQTELSAGTYEVLITDENGCVTNNIVMISEAQSGLDATIISQVDMECVGSGSVIIEANGGTLPYEFTLNGVTTQNNGSFNDLAEGNNTIIVEDANGCSFTVPVFIVNKCIGLVKEVELFDDDGDNCADEGEELHYTFTVNNMGNVELTDVIITDPLVTVTGGPITLQPGEIDATTFTADYMITENDVVNIGEVVNQATAFGTTPSDENVSDLSDNENFLEDDPTVFDNFCKVIVNAPTIAIIKEAMIVDENDNGCPDIGETILYTFKVKNTSTEEELINVVIIDPMVEVLGSPITLSIGGIDTDTFTALHTITQEDLDATYIDNQAMAIGTGSDSQLSAEDLSHETSFTEDGFTTVYFCQPALGIELEKSGQWNDENGDGGADEGETISYTFSVTNTGDEPLYNITLEDPLPGIVMEGGPIEVLMPLQTDDTSFTATYTLSQEDVDNLEVINQATVTGENNNGNSVITEVSDDPSTVEENDPTVIILPDVGGVLFEIFNGITPNGDGFNDYFQIDGIDQFSNNNVKIFNRWGILIFETNGYNESSNVFKGESNARATIEGDRDVPTGTYFYIITFPDVNPGKDSYSGYLYINR